jgi:hypothetical protein
MVVAGAIALLPRPHGPRGPVQASVNETALPAAGSALPVVDSAPAEPIAAVPNVVAPGTDAPSAPVPNQTVDELKRKMARRFHGQVGRLFVYHLVEQGLSRADSELIVRSLTENLTTCAFDALREQAAAQSVSFDDVLTAVEAAFYHADGPEPSALIDVHAVAQRQAPCSLNVLQQAGIPATDVLPLAILGL